MIEAWDNAEIRKIARHVSRETEISLADIYSKKRVRKIAHARFIVMWLAKRAGYSLTQIGRAFDRDHSTVLNALRRVDKIMGET